MSNLNRLLLPQDATEKEIQAAITAIERVLAYKPDFEYRATFDLDYYRLRLKRMSSAK